VYENKIHRWNSSPLVSSEERMNSMQQRSR
jgi:hypothetical protein